MLSLTFLIYNIFRRAVWVPIPCPSPDYGMSETGNVLCWQAMVSVLGKVIGKACVTYYGKVGSDVVVTDFINFKNA
jgi:hypothetical protein